MNFLTGASLLALAKSIYYKLRQYWEAILLGIPDGKASLAFKKNRRNFIPNQVVDSKPNSLLIEFFSYRWDNIVN